MRPPSASARFIFRRSTRRTFSKKLLRCGLTLACSSSANSRSSSSCRGLSDLGTSMFTCTSRSPTSRPRGLGMPRPRSLNTSPDCVPGGIFNSCGPVERGHLDLRAQRRLRVGDRHANDQVLPLALEQRVLLDRDEAVAVAARAAVGARFPLAGQPQPHLVVDARGNLHVALHRAGARNPWPRQLGQGSLIDRCRRRGTTGRSSARGRCRSLAPPGRARRSSCTCSRLRAGLGARAVAVGAFFVPLELDGLGHAAGRFEQIERHVAADVAPPC